MEILIFKTNIQCKEDLQILQPFLNNEPCVINWNVDQDDVECVLRIESTENCPEKIMDLLKQTGFECEELSD